MAAEINAKAPLFIDASENFKKWQVGFEAQVSFEGLKGIMIWKILHGTWTKEKSVTLIDEIELFKSEPIWIHK